MSNIFAYSFVHGKPNGKIETLEFGKQTATVEVALNWKKVRLLPGMPLTLVGPKIKDRRSVIFIKNLGEIPLEEPKVPLSKLLGKNSHYQKEREKWVKQNKGKTLAYYPYTFKNRTPASGKPSKSLSTGHKYLLSGKTFEERVHFLSCNENVFEVQTLLPLDSGKSAGEELNAIVDSFTCSGVEAKK